MDFCVSCDLLFLEGRKPVQTNTCRLWFSFYVYHSETSFNFGYVGAICVDSIGTHRIRCWYAICLRVEMFLMKIRSFFYVGFMPWACGNWIDELWWSRWSSCFCLIMPMMSMMWVEERSPAKQHHSCSLDTKIQWQEEFEYVMLWYRRWPNNFEFQRYYWPMLGNGVGPFSIRCVSHWALQTEI